MAALLEPIAAPSAPALVSVEDYEKMGERINGYRTELIRGVIINKMSASPPHAFLVMRLRRLVSAALGAGMYCREEKPLKLAGSVSMPEPGLAVCAGQEEDCFHSHPATALLVVAVSISSRRLDRQKIALYAEADIPEYWIILPEEQAVEAHTDPQQGRYAARRLYTRAETLPSAALPGLSVDLASLFPAG